jgi:hypothetical protein
MEEITKISEQAIERYFTALSQFGYKNYEEVAKLIALIFIEEVLTEDFIDLITEEDYRAMMDAMYCLSGSTCLIPYPEFINNDTLFHPIGDILSVRLSEVGNIRTSQGNIIRIEA